MKSPKPTGTEDLAAKDRSGIWSGLGPNALTANAKILGFSDFLSE
jgi:hypothetical protein